MSNLDYGEMFTEDFIKKAVVPTWKYWLLPLVQPMKWRQAKWTFTTEDGKKMKMKGLIRL